MFTRDTPNTPGLFNFHAIFFGQLTFFVVKIKKILFQMVGFYL